MGSRGGSALRIVAPGAWASAWVDPLTSGRTLPLGLDIADDGLATGIDVDMLDRDLLLDLAAVAVQRRNIAGPIFSSPHAGRNRPATDVTISASRAKSRKHCCASLSVTAAN
jgi:hypothetical protein